MKSLYPAFISVLVLFILITFDLLTIKRILDYPLLANISTILFGIVMFLAQILIALKFFKLSEIGFTSKNLFLTFVYGLVLVIPFFVFRQLYFPQQFNPNLNLNFILIAVPLLLIFALVEELVFRGILFTTINKWKGAEVALFTSSVAFGLFHLITPMMGVSSINTALGYTTTQIGIGTLFLGLSYGMIYYRSGNLIGTAIVHFIYNLTNVFYTLKPSQELNLPDSAYSLSFGLFVFTPLGIDYLHSKLSKKDKPAKFSWSIYLAWIFVFIFLFFLGSDLLTDLKIME